MTSSSEKSANFWSMVQWYHTTIPYMTACVVTVAQGMWARVSSRNNTSTTIAYIRMVPTCVFHPCMAGAPVRRQTHKEQGYLEELGRRASLFGHTRSRALSKNTSTRSRALSKNTRQTTRLFSKGRPITSLTFRTRCSLGLGCRSLGLPSN